MDLERAERYHNDSFARVSKIIPNVDVKEGTKGIWTIKKRHVEFQDLDNLRELMNNRATPTGDYTCLIASGRGVIMSDTLAEKRDHCRAVLCAEGDVLINGLGLGMVAKAMLLRSQVTKLTIVELDKDVIDLVGYTLTDDPRVTIVNESAFDYSPPKGETYGFVWHDIWDTISEDNLPEMTKLKRKYSRRAKEQGCWAEHECKRLRRSYAGF